MDPRDPAAVTNRQGQQFADADLARELADLTRAANRANATIYTVDPRGLIGGAEMDDEVDMVEWNNHVRKTQDSMRVLAEETGGIAVVNQNDFVKALKRKSTRRRATTTSSAITRAIPIRPSGCARWT